MRRTRNEAGNKRGIILLLIGAHGPFAVQCSWRMVKAASPLQCAVAKNASVSALESAVAKLLNLKSLEMNSCEKGGGGGWLHAGFRFSTIETSRRFGVDKTCPLPKAFLQVAKGLLAGYGRGDFVRVNTLHVSRIDGRDHIKVSLARQHAVVCVGGCRYRRGIQLLVRPARLCATVDVVVDSPGRIGIPA